MITVNFFFLWTKEMCLMNQFFEGSGHCLVEGSGGEGVGGGGDTTIHHHHQQR